MDDTEILKRVQVLGVTGLEEMRKGDMIRANQIAEGSRYCFEDI